MKSTSVGRVKVALGVVTLSLAIGYGYKLSHPPNYLETIGLYVPVQQLPYQSQDWLWGMLYIKAQLSHGDLERYLTVVTQAEIKGIPKHQAIDFDPSSYRDFLSAHDGGKEFFPSYDQTLKGGKFQIRNRRGTRYYCKYVYTPVEDGNLYLLYLLAIPSEASQ